MPKLNEQEQQEVIRFLEAGKSLPDKYRFLLFDDKREVELVWNGKTGDVCNVVLPFQTIEQIDEPRSEKELKLQPGFTVSKFLQYIWPLSKSIIANLDIHTKIGTHVEGRVYVN